MLANRFSLWFLCVLLVAATAATSAAAPLGSGFLYQAQLKMDGKPLDDTADFRFTLYDAVTIGATVDGPLTISNEAVASGLANVELDFGANVFDGTALWLEVEVRSPHDPTNLLPFTTLLPRQLLAATPFALQTRGIFSIRCKTSGSVSRRRLGASTWPRATWWLRTPG